jgi:hypothetical protein
VAERLSDVLLLARRGAVGKCRWLQGKLDDPPDPNGAAAVRIVADVAMRWQCRGAIPRYQDWRAAIDAGAKLGAAERARVEPFIRPAFGLPGRPIPPDHLQGHVAEYVWYILAKENVPADLALQNLEGPSFSVTTPGGDGLAVYRRGDDVLIFRLWEIKKHDSKLHVSRTVSRAYKQLDAKAHEYLAELTTLASVYPDPVNHLYAAMSDLWVDRSDRAGVGVAVATSDQHLPARCFGTMHESFPDLTIDQLDGMVVALGEFPSFAAAVRDRIWNAL